jgi:hypothetical protein
MVAKYKYLGINYWSSHFNDLKNFDILPYKDLVDRYIKTSNELKPNHQKFGWNERPINSDKETLHKGKNWNGYDPVYFDVDPTGEKVVTAKADVISMDMKGVGESWDSFVYITLPCDFINEHLTQMHDNDDVTIARKFIDEVENTPEGWEGDNWKVIEKEYDIKYPEISQFTDMYETHTCIKWKQDFDIRQYISIKQKGLIFPICYNSKGHILDRGTHRAVLGAKAQNDIPIFVQYDSKNPTDLITLQTSKFFSGESLTLKLHIKDKKIEYFRNNKLIAES